MCAFLFGRQCHRNSEWVVSDLELLVGLALPHVTEQVPAGLSDASCRGQHRLPGLCEGDITTFITLAWRVLAHELSKTDFWVKAHPRKPFSHKYSLGHVKESMQSSTVLCVAIKTTAESKSEQQSTSSHLCSCRLNRSEQI